MPGLHSRRDSTRQDENESVEGTFGPRLEVLGDMSVNQSQVKENEDVSTLSWSFRKRVWMSTFVHILYSSHLAEDLDEYPWRECKPDIIKNS